MSTTYLEHRRANYFFHLHVLFSLSFCNMTYVCSRGLIFLTSDLTDNRLTNHLRPGYWMTRKRRDCKSRGVVTSSLHYLGRYLMASSSPFLQISINSRLPISSFCAIRLTQTYS